MTEATAITPTTEEPTAPAVSSNGNGKDGGMNFSQQIIEASGMSLNEMAITYGRE